jgi:toxin FitB
MSFLVDTNVISELRKGERGNPGVLKWAKATQAELLYTSVLVMAELRRGIELKRRRDAAQAEALDRWFSAVEVSFGSRVLAIDSRIADAWGRLGVPDPIPVVDGLLAATAKVNGLTLVTRNAVDMRKTNVPVLNPFTKS